MNSMRAQVGVLALQGDYEKHIQSLIRCGVGTVEVRQVSDLESCNKLIIPGGESTTLEILLKSSGLDKEIFRRFKEGMPIWGTCMGMILLSKAVERSDQWTLGLIDISVRRNAFGRQIHSFEEDLTFKGLVEPFRAVFIRAPIVTRFGSDVDILASIGDKIVAVSSGKILATAFHPELTNDLRIHQIFLAM